LADAPAAVFETRLASLPLLHRGKVRDVYAAGPDHLLIVTTDRLSAFDVVLPDPIPGKGRILHGISEFWFDSTAALIRNHRTQRQLTELTRDPAELALLAGRASIVRRLAALPIEAVVRGYLAGSGWKDYQRTGMVCGHALPAGLKLADQLPEPIFTPATKAAAGAHDQNIGYAEVVELVGADHARAVRDTAIAIYRHAAEHARARGIIIADTKFEFGVDADGALTLIDEVLTPDSSRYWDRAEYEAGRLLSFDKQLVRDWLDRSGWNHEPPAPALPPDIVVSTQQRYLEAIRRLSGAPR